jgi:hypothetical protein
LSGRADGQPAEVAHLGEPGVDPHFHAELLRVELERLFLVTDDCQATYDELSARGVEFTDPPTQQPYGIDTGFRDPFGNNIRLTQVMEFSLDGR